ncbi:adenosylcobinamide-phosphate synthase CbiB [Desulfuromonas sp. TF]|uniref:adenosylcobinamide-phosphate synthase CbiB n=1 Tax=Desulfuromonas sp. TF TaxID=1232410 RepID=UPI0003FF07DC|nr:adenosylcobinamide-phosphate synthase CbiB [Desulfuromonas sp. TF]
MDLLIPAAFALDLLLGDPRWLPHPVVYIGACIKWLEGLLTEHVGSRRLAGVLLTALTLAATGAAASVFLYLAAEIDPLFGWAAALWLAFTTLALRSLHKESRAVVKLVEEGRPDEARQALALIVGRDTAGLSEEAVVKACIETVAENTSDGIVAPLFYLFLGGPVLAVLYKAANTLDSMVGYRNERYRELGWASARLDDLLNLIPARLTGVLMALAAWPLGLDPWGALKIMGRDARKPASPNAGFPEAAAAGALGVQLGGPASYFGKQVEKPVLGDPDRPVTVTAYRKMVRLMYLTSFLALALGVILTWLIR